MLRADVPAGVDHFHRHEPFVIEVRVGDVALELANGIGDVERLSGFYTDKSARKQHLAKACTYRQWVK